LGRSAPPSLPASLHQRENESTEGTKMTTHHHHDHDHDTGAASGGGSCGGHAPSADDLAQVGAEDIAECPVMVGTTVLKAQAEDAGLYRDYQGTRYYLC